MNLTKYLPRVVVRPPFISLAAAVIVAPPLVTWVKDKVTELTKKPGVV